MNNYFAKVTGFMPCPREKEFNIKATSLATASARAIREFRKELKRKRIKRLSIKLEVL